MAINKNGETFDTEYQAYYDKRTTEFSDGTKALENLRFVRNQKLKETDYLATSDNIMSDEIKAFRKSMRDIPQDYSADKYDELLARETDETKDNFGQLTHTVWSKP